jgi:hypothetical protein
MRGPGANEHRASWSTRVAGAVIVLCFVSVSIYVLWTLDRGFELTDEAYYLLLAMQPDASTLYVSAQHWVTSVLWQATGSISAFRALGLLILVSAAFLLAIGVHSACLTLDLIHDRRGSKAVLVAAAAVGAMLYASTINLSPCYNLLASAGAYAAGGLVLLASTCASRPRKFALHFLAGSALAIEALCKASAGASTFALLLLWLFVFERAYPHRIFGALAMASGLVAFSFLALLGNTTLSDAARAIEEGMLLFRIVQAEAIDVRLLRYAEQFKQSLLATLTIFALPLLAFIGYVRTRRMMFVLIGTVILIAALILGEHWLGGWDADGSLKDPTALFALLIAALVLSIPLLRKNLQRAALMGGLALLPYTVAMGTGNMLFTQVIVSLAPWGVLVAALVMTRPSEAWHPLPAALIGICFVGTVSSQILTSGERPYHLADSLHKQDIPTALEELGVVKVDSRTYEFLQDLQTAKRNCGILPGATFIGLYNIPGVALVLQSVPLISPWLNNAAQADFVLERTPTANLSAVVLAVNLSDKGALPPLPARLRQFPVGYRYCGTAIYPYNNQEIQIWRSRDPTTDQWEYRK